ncbi:tail fiber protein [Flavobacterium sp. F-65]|uniref:Tail fiber protein n=1 Tax=Flavobacterium pisciphilum TaxID=2893755 RepID=A0ABS8MZI9_9FLAO|nr:tail fiber protein [Flavobacterium sp. F-65]MCC9073586.1 tail fiber protein [Flavobacterium sp. F-65]
MKTSYILITIFATSFCIAQNSSLPLSTGSFSITNDGVHNTLINSGNVAQMNMGFDGTTGFITFGAHTGNGYKDNILYMRGSDSSVGIGTSQITSSLSIGNNHGIKLSVGNTSWNNKSIIQTGWNTQIGDFTEINVPGHATNNAFIRIAQNGYLGIGTIVPSAILDVYSPVIAQGRHNSQKWSTGNSGYDLTLQTIWNNSGINQEFVQRYNGVDYTSLAFFQGKVGIGTQNPDEKLTVNGKIHAQEVRIDLQSPMTVPDYVFANDYKLKSLQEVEEFIKQNSHLPEIPSAKEIEKNGLMLAEMNMSLLKKMEEMTLYLIEQEKKNAIQSEKIERLEKENNAFKSLSERLSKIENQLKK